jgi:hypothetical protein
VIVAAVIAFLAGTMAVPYVMDWCGLSISPAATFVFSTLIAATAGAAARRITMTREETIGFAAVVLALFGWLSWIAWPSMLPQGRGPDLTHHLMLIDYIDQHWQLPHDPGLGASLGEMMDYTPGLHLLAATAGAWMRSDGLHAIYPVVALTVALKAGLVFLISMRLLPLDVPRLPFAVVAPVLLLVPREYFLRSFIDASFLAQVVSECFAVAMWWAVVEWRERPSAVAGSLFAIAGVGVFLSWPVWLGPLMLVFAAALVSAPDLSAAQRVRHLAIGIAPIAIVAALHAAGHARAARIVAVGGYVPLLTGDFFGWWFLTLAAAGLLVAAMDGRRRTVVWLTAAIALQSAALFVLATRSGAARPYQALKMMYLLIYPLAVAGSIALAGAWGLMGGKGWMGRMGKTGERREMGFPSSLSRPSRLSRPLTAWLVLAGVAGVALPPSIRAPRARPVVTEPLLVAGQWVRAHLPPACIDYLVADDYSAYWLHLAVLRNPRSGKHDDDLFEAKKAVMRWVLPDGLPFAIAEDFDALPRDIRVNVDILARFGPAAVIKRRGLSSCAS